MACLNCSECIDYVDGKLSIVVDPDGQLGCDDQGRLGHADDICPVVGDLTAPIPQSTIETCGNGIKVTCDGELWMDPVGCVEEFDQSATGFHGQLIGHNSAFITPSLNLSLPAADKAYDTTYKVAVQREARFDQAFGTDFQLLDIIGGVTNATDLVDQWTFPGSRHFSRVSKGFMWETVLPAGSPATSVPFQIRVRTLGNISNSQGVLYDYSFQWCGVKIAMKRV